MLNNSKYYSVHKVKHGCYLCTGLYRAAPSDAPSEAGDIVHVEEFGIFAESMKEARRSALFIKRFPDHPW